jgi:hypothetical protein
MSKKSTNTNDLFDNPMIRAAKNAMSCEEQERYAMLGKSMYNSLDFENANATDNIPPPMAEALAYIEEGLKSGLHPSMLEENEIALLVDTHGKLWYTRWGYVEEDLSDIVTTKK